jgi:LacI family transcriptional regulator
MKIEDIARLANVSKSAVSLAINGKPGISEDTRNKILKIAKEHGYIPRTNKLQSLPSTTVNHTLRFVACTNSGIVHEQFNQLPFFMELIHYLEKHTRTNGYSLLYSTVPINELESGLAQLESDHETDGIILLGTNLPEDLIRLISAKQQKLVVIDTCYETLNANFILMNNFMGAYQAARHLIELGHKRIGYVQSTSRIYNFNERQRGFLRALEEAYLTLRDEDIFTAAPTDITVQEEFINAVRQRSDLPTALFCECDYIAISVIKSLHELGIRVPDDISIIGFDNIQESMVIMPELTTVHVEKERIAEVAVKTLIGIIENNDPISMKTLIDTRIISRNSCRAVLDSADLIRSGAG